MNLYPLKISKLMFIYEIRIPGISMVSWGIPLGEGDSMIVL